VRLLGTVQVRDDLQAACLRRFRNSEFLQEEAEVAEENHFMDFLCFLRYLL
jgi:hypothetical protein